MNFLQWTHLQLLEVLSVFCVIYVVILVSDAFVQRITMLSWRSDLLNIMKCPSLFLIAFLVLKMAVLEISILISPIFTSVTGVYFSSPFAIN